MPSETASAVAWALQQKDSFDSQITAQTKQALVDKVREYFNAHGVTYMSFTSDDLAPFLP